MKNYILLIYFLGVSYLVSGQNDHRTNIISIIDSVYTNFNEFDYTDADDSLINIADSLLLLEFYKIDTLLAKKMSAYWTYRKFLGNADGMKVNETASEDKLMTDVWNYLKSQKIIYQDSMNRIANIIINDDVDLLNYNSVSSDTSFLCNLFRNSITINQYKYTYDRLNNLLDSSEMTQFYYDNIHYFTKDTFEYFQILKKAKMDHKPYPFSSITMHQYIHMYDTTEHFNKMYYHYLILDDKSWIEAHEDSTFGVENRRKLELLEEGLREKKQDDLEYKRVNDSINVATIYDRFPIYWKHAYSDTTLWLGNGSVPVLEADDGMRFDTFPTEVLLGIIDTINFHSVYDTMQDGLDLNQSVTVIHLRKIFQILGDRNANGLFSPDSSQKAIINRWIDDYKYIVCNNSFSDIQSEANHQLLRMWRLLYPRFKVWYVEYELCLELLGYTANYFHTMMTEDMVLNMITEADLYYANGENNKLYALAFFLENIWRNVDLKKNQLLPRRPARNAVESQRWVDDNIYPALKRWKIPGIE